MGWGSGLGAWRAGFRSSGECRVEKGATDLALVRSRPERQVIAPEEERNGLPEPRSRTSVGQWGACSSLAASDRSQRIWSYISHWLSKPSRGSSVPRPAFRALPHRWCTTRPAPDGDGRAGTELASSPCRARTGPSEARWQAGRGRRLEQALSRIKHRMSLDSGPAPRPYPWELAGAPPPEQRDEWSQLDPAARPERRERRFAALQRALVAETTDSHDSLRTELAWPCAGTRVGRREGSS